MKILVYIQSIFSLEIFFAPIMVPFYLNYIGLTFKEMTIIFSIIMFSNMIFEIPSGAVSDKFGRKNVLLIGNAVYLISMIGLLVIKNFNILLIIAVMFSLGNSLSSGNMSAVVFENLTCLNIQKESFYKISTKAASLMLTASAIAAVVGGYLGNIFLALPLIIDIFFLFLNMILSYFFLEELSLDYMKRTQKYNVLKNIKEIKNIIGDAIFIMLKNKKIIFFCIFSALNFSILRSGFNFYQPLLESVNIDLVYFGTILAIFNLIAALISYLSGKYISNILNKYNILISLIISSLFIVSGFLSLNNTALYCLVLAFVFHQIIRGFGDSYFNYSINKEVPKEQNVRTTILSVNNAIRAIAATCIMFFSGVVSELTNINIGFFILSFVGGVLLMINILWLYIITKKEVIS